MLQCLEDSKRGIKMSDDILDGIKQIRLQEYDDYLTKREELRQAEIESLKSRERVAQLRRALPPGPVLQDYEFIEGPSLLANGDAPIRKVRLSELFTRPERALVVYQFMFG